MNETFTNRAAYTDALAIAKARHIGKLDDFGAPYYQHFVRVAAKLMRFFPSATDSQIQAALLHDVFEPLLPYTDEYLLDRGVTSPAIEIIRRITLPTEPFNYLDYVRILVASGDKEAIQVKYADNADALEYFPKLKADDARRRMISERYEPTRTMLAQALAS